MIPGSTVEFSLGGELFHDMYSMTHVSVSLIHVSLCCLRRRPLQYSDYKLGEAIQLYVCPYVWYIEERLPLWGIALQIPSTSGS